MKQSFTTILGPTTSTDNGYSTSEVGRRNIPLRKWGVNKIIQRGADFSKAEAKANIKEAIIGWLAVMNEKTKRRHAQLIEVLV